jgi:hypothetical protein
VETYRPRDSRTARGANRAGLTGQGLPGHFLDATLAEEAPRLKPDVTFTEGPSSGCLVSPLRRGAAFSGPL